MMYRFHKFSTSVSKHLSVLIQTKIFSSGYDTDGIGVSHTSAPALDADDGFVLLEDAELDGVEDAPLQAVVDIFLPRRITEIRLLYVVMERIHPAGQMRVAGGAGVARHHDDGADGAIFRDKASSGAATEGHNIDQRPHHAQWLMCRHAFGCMASGEGRWIWEKRCAGRDQLTRW